MGVAEAVELGGRALGVGTHVFEVQPVTNIKLVVEADALRDAVNPIAGRAPNGILDPIVHPLSNSICIRRVVVASSA